MLKVPPPSSYPPEKGCYLRGNDYSPVAVVVLLNAPYGTMPPEVQGIPKEIENLVKVAIETGAALSGTLQTENIGIEKIICNVAANPNIRYLIVCGNEVEGHDTGTAIKALIENGIDERRTIIGSQAKTPYLFNIPLEAIYRFREQLTLIDLIGETDPEVIIKGVWSCYQETPTPFKEYKLYDLGAYSESAISSSLTWKVKHPEEVEDWEIDDILKGVEESAEPAEKLKKTGGEHMKEGRRILAITKRLLKVTQELSEIAMLCIEEIEGLEAPPEIEMKKEEAFIPEKAKSAVKVVPVVKELPETEEELYFANQLRGYSGVLAAFEALDNDICHNGCTLPGMVITTQKRLKRLKEGIGKSSLSEEKKKGLEKEVNDFMERIEALPQDTDKPCQKEVGTCTIGKGCFASGALKLMNFITEPAPPKYL
ncbi:MAG: tetrahydromethanopterin S-methyltransferase subunit A [Thermodesulfovibrionales bacterium]|nr:tetrahydromethanopterin S-methyltransferase subunit A [Thermodesulfovibrionales bacterium]